MSRRRPAFSSLYRRTALVALLGVGSLALGRPAGAQEVPSCTTTTTTTTKCTGQFAPLAVPGAEAAPAAPAPAPVYTAPAPQPAAPPVYAPAPYPLYNPSSLFPQAAAPRYEEKPRYGLFAAGLSMFGAIYFWNVTAAVLASDGRPAIPIVGPLTLMSNHTEPFVNYFMVLDALVQASGVVMMITGLATKKKVAVYDQPKVSFLPVATSSSAGVALTGNF